MKANEFVKQVGFKSAKTFLERNRFDMVQIKSGFKRDLKRLVESHELIESCGGLEQAKAYAIDANACGAFNDEIKLKQVILDVESCQ